MFPLPDEATGPFKTSNKAPEAPTSTPIALSSVMGSFRNKAASSIVKIGSKVTTIEALIDEVIDNPIK